MTADPPFMIQESLDDTPLSNGLEKVEVMRASDATLYKFRKGHSLEQEFFRTPSSLPDRFPSAKSGTFLFLCGRSLNK
eukprot:scaffold24719_cov147-Cylindrotheca_fusiformis.AAC.3